MLEAIADWLVKGIGPLGITVVAAALGGYYLSQAITRIKALEAQPPFRIPQDVLTRGELDVALSRMELRLTTVMHETYVGREEYDRQHGEMLSLVNRSVGRLERHEEWHSRKGD
jgi:hypothetical protein